MLNLSLQSVYKLFKPNVYALVGKKLVISWYLLYYHHHSILPNGRSSTANSRTKAAVLLKDRSSNTNLRNQAAVLLRMDRCGSFPLLSAPHYRTLKDLKNSRGTWVMVRRVVLAIWVLLNRPIFTTGVKYQFHQDFLPYQRSGNPN